MKSHPFPVACAVATAWLVAGCNEPRTPQNAGAPPPKHEHRPPHGGTAVELGKEEFHLEIVRDAAAGRLTAYVMDGELENFVRIAEPALVLVAKGPSGTTNLTLRATANPATGETVGDTAQFAGEAAWIRDVPVFDGLFPELKIRGHTYNRITFNFPRGNEAGKER